MNAFVNVLVVCIVLMQAVSLSRSVMEAALSTHKPYQHLARLSQIAVKKVTAQIAEGATDLRAILADFAIQGRYT